METTVGKEKLFTTTIKWIARTGSILVWSFILLILFGEGGFSPGMLSITETVMLILFWGSLIGLIIAWKWPAVGGIISLGLMSAFYILELFISGSMPHSWAFIVIALPGLFFLVYFLLVSIEQA